MTVKSEQKKVFDLETSYGKIPSYSDRKKEEKEKEKEKPKP